MNRFGILSKPLAWLMAVLLTVFAAGCGGGGDSGSSTAATTTAAGPIIPGASCTATGALIPRVTTSSPVSGDLTVTTSTSGVAGGGKLITASFSLAMNPATINSNPAGTLSTFTIKNNTTAGSTVIGTVAMNVSATVEIGRAHV